MALTYAILAGAVCAAVAVFALQNPRPVAVSFLGWTIGDVPLAAVVLASLAAGAVVVGLPLLIQRWRLRARVRSLEARLEKLQPTTPRTSEPPRSAAMEP